MSEKKRDAALSAVPQSERQHWMVPATIFAGLAFAVPVLMVGATLVGSFGISTIVWILLATLILIQLGGNALQGYIGAKTGRPSAVIARSSFGAIQARYIVGLALIILNVGWFGLNTAIAGNALAATLNINYSEQWLLWGTLTIIAGLIFALPAVLGYNSMKWVDFIAMPAGILLIITAVVFALKKSGGWQSILSWNPEPSMTIFGAISLILGVNVAQWLIASDYTRYSKPRVKDQIFIPLGIIITQLILFTTGAIMAVGIGEADIVAVMQNLGFPFWGFIILFIALWTSQIVASYSIGLAASNMFNIDTGKGRAILTFVGSLFGVILALGGILDHFTGFLTLLAVVYPAVAAVMFVDFFFIRNQKWADNQGWNWTATICILVGMFVGYITQYVIPFGIPALQSLIISAIVYYAAVRIKSRVKPDCFTNPELSEISMDEDIVGTKEG